jgi:formylglycine-generating enzyme required for sulfatase activity
MTKVAIAEEIAERIRSSEGPIELVDAQGQTVGVVRRPPTEAEIERARSRASQDGKRLSWAQVAAKVRDGVAE